ASRWRRFGATHHSSGTNRRGNGRWSARSLFAYPNTCRAAKLGRTSVGFFLQARRCHSIADGSKQALALGGEIANYLSELRFVVPLSINLAAPEFEIELRVFVGGHFSFFFKRRAQALLFVDELLEMFQVSIRFNVRRIDALACCVDDLIWKFHPPRDLK